MLLIGPAHANLITNGSFEDVVLGSFKTGITDSDVPGWHIPDSNGVYPWLMRDGSFGAFTPYGEQFVVLGLYTTGFEYSIEQTLTGLTVGNLYDVSFAIASELDCCSQLELSFVGSSTAASVYVAPASGQWWTDWATFNTTFVATSSTVTLIFKQESPGNGLDIGLDNVVVTAAQAVPVPGTIALLGLGLAGMAATLRRKK